MSDQANNPSPLPAANSVDFDAKHFRTVLGHFPTGVTVITGMIEGDRPHGFTIGSFTSVSLDPPLVGFLPPNDARVRGTIELWSANPAAGVAVRRDCDASDGTSDALSIAPVTRACSPSVGDGRSCQTHGVRSSGRTGIPHS